MNRGLLVGTVEGAPQALASDGHLMLLLTAQRSNPLSPAAFQRFRAQRGKDALERLARGDAIGQAEKALEPFALGPPEGRHRLPPVCSTNHRAERDHQHIGQQVPPTSELARILDTLQTLDLLRNHLGPSASWKHPCSTANGPH